MEKIIDFEAKKQMKLVKQIRNDNDEIAEMVIQMCFENGQKEYELAAELLTGIQEVDEYEDLNSTFLSMYIERIAQKGYQREADELRTRMWNRLDHQYERLISKKGSEIRKVKGKKVYTDPEGLFDSLPKEERDRIAALTRDVINGKVDYSQMTKQKVYNLMKDVAKYAFYMSDEAMRKLVLDDQECRIEFTFRGVMPVMEKEKAAIAQMMLAFNDFSVFQKPGDRSSTMAFEFFPL